MDSVTISVHQDNSSRLDVMHEQAISAGSSSNLTPPRDRTALHAAYDFDGSGAKRAAAIGAAAAGTGAPQSCMTSQTDWTNLDQILLSCVSFATGPAGVEVQDPIGTALNITGNGINVIGVRLFGCTDTALEIHGVATFISVRCQL
jgi:hypothetical protein